MGELHFSSNEARKAKRKIGGELRVMNEQGDENVLKWSDDPTSIRMAREHFKRMRDAGFDWFALTEDDDRGGRITEFDEDLPGAVAVKRMQGG